MEQKPGYEQLAQRVAELEQLLDEASDAIYTLAPDTTITSLNVPWERLTGYSRDEWIGKSFASLVHPEDLAIVTKEILSALGTGSPCRIEGRHKKKTGEYVWGEYAIKPLMKDNNCVIVFGIARDITEPKRIEKDLREKQARLLTTQRVAAMGFLDWNLKTNEIYWSEEVYRLCGIEPNEKIPSLDMTMDLAHPDDREFVKSNLDMAIQGVKNYNIEHRILRLDGTVLWVRAQAELVRDAEGNPKSLLGTIVDITDRKSAELALQEAHDRLERKVEERTRELLEANEALKVEITERKQTKKALKESELRYQTLLENAPVGIFHATPDGGGEYINPKMAEMTGLTPETAKGTGWTSRIHPDDIEDMFHKWTEFVAGRGLFYCTFRISPRAGEERWALSTAQPLYDDNRDLMGFIGTATDITERKRAEEEKARLEAALQQTQKIEALGTLAGGIAHDFNNILGIIIGNTELAMIDVPEWNPACYNLEEVRKASLRARDMVRQILSFSRQTEQEAKPIRIFPILEESLKLIRSSIPTTIEIRQNFSTHIKDTILGDPTQINQILINLCTNATHAMLEGGGILEVSLKNRDLYEKDAARYQDITPGKYVILTVSDTGHGIEPNIMARIFDPYFTTKEVGEGTGMGLSVVLGIVKNHKGAIHVYSEPEKGTTFNLFFPLIESEPVTESTSLGPLPTGPERILFVDDEQALAELGKRMLQQLGYEVTVRTSSIEALEAFREQPDKFDLVVTDMTMPNMTGTDLCKEIMQIRLDIPIILCTGFSEMITEDKAKRMGIKAFLMKPLAMRKMAETIRRIFDQTEIELAENLR